MNKNDFDWTEADGVLAAREGWCMSAQFGRKNFSDGVMAIERLDDPSSVERSLPDTPFFDSDSAAVTWVIARAHNAKPDSIHYKAIVMAGLDPKPAQSVELDGDTLLDDSGRMVAHMATGGDLMNNHERDLRATMESLERRYNAHALLVMALSRAINLAANPPLNDAAEKQAVNDLTECRAILNQFKGA